MNEAHDAPDWTEVKRVFQEALRRPPAERAAHVAEAAGGDAALAAEVLELLESHEAAGAAFGEVPALPDAGLAPGGRVGPYRLVDVLGEGGFAVVFRAEQERPVRREVALKVLVAALDAGQVLARFEAEREALARMEHPGIARLLDAGATEGGRPWFAMELVRGAPITTWCAERGLDARARLALFADVCRAVQHAHERGVVHRDLKPSNVLVTEIDGRPAVKVIDFGIAKALEGRLGERAPVTELRLFLGTPEYVAPEQAERGAAAVDERADVYALGCLLYELATGTTPHDAALLRAVAWDELRRVLREVDPPRPSARAAHVPRELDWIALRALEKEPARRYASAGALADDVARHLAHEALEAAPPSALYRLGRRLRRQRRAAAVSAVLLAAALAGAAATTQARVRARVQEERARELAVLAMHRGEEARRARAAADAASDFVRQALLDVDPDAPTAAAPSAVELLERAARRIDAQELSAEVEADVRRVLGESFAELGRPRDAVRQLARALELLADQGRLSERSTIAAEARRGESLALAGELEAAAASLERARELGLGSLPANDPLTAVALAWRGLVLRRSGSPAAGERAVREALAELEAALGPDAEAAGEVRAMLHALEGRSSPPPEARWHALVDG